MRWTTTDKDNIYHTIFEFSQEAVFVATFDGQIVDVNFAACKLMQYSRDELLSLNVQELSPPEERQSLKDVIFGQKVMRERAFVGHILRKNGSKIVVEVRVKDFILAEQHSFLLFIRDITEQTEARKKLQAQNQFFKAMNQVSIGLLSRLGREDILIAILRQVSELFGTADACIAFPNKERQILVQKIGIGRYADCVITFQLGEGLMGRVWESGKPMVVENYKNWIGRLQHPLADMAQVCAAIPLKVDGKVIGVLGMDFYDKLRSVTDDDMEMFGQFAQVASIALVNEELYSALVYSEKQLQQRNAELTAAYEELMATEEELRKQFSELVAHEEEISQQNTVLASLHETSLGLLNGLDFDAVLMKIIVSAAKLVGTEHAWMYLLDNECGKFIGKFALGILSQVEAAERELFMERLIGLGCKTREILVVDDCSIWEKPWNSGVLDKIHCIVQVPLKEKDSIIGFFTLAFTNENCTFGEKEITMLKRFAEMAAIALANARLYSIVAASEKELQKNNQELTATHEELVASENELRQQFYALMDQEEKIRRLSLFDSITGVYNRTYFEEALKKIEEKQELGVCLLMCDLDGLKIINDTLGHSAGDLALKAVATILKEYFQDEDLVARIGGDEFAVLLHNAESRVKTDCVNIRKSFDQYNLENPTLPISVSMGFAVSCRIPIEMKALFREADNNMYREKLHRSKSSRSAIVQALITALEARDFQTEGHSDRLQQLMDSMAMAMNIPVQQRADLRLFARFHDIGKVGIPDYILFKPAKLSEEEYEVMRQHSDIGHRIALSAPDLVPIADWILKHHERWDGHGYPLGLNGEHIPLACRMLGIVDAYDAMTSDRPYRKAMSEWQAIMELKRCSGTQFDPELVDVFTALL